MFNLTHWLGMIDVLAPPPTKVEWVRVDGQRTPSP